VVAVPHAGLVVAAPGACPLPDGRVDGDGMARRHERNDMIGVPAMFP